MFLISEAHKLCHEGKKRKLNGQLVNPQLDGHLISLVLKPYVIILDHFLSFPLLVVFQC